jgi:hypothetical protein
MHAVMQDLQQIRSICQQLAQSERQNAQQLQAQPGLQTMAQRESFAAQQLQQCVQLCQRIEQALTQQQAQFTPSYTAAVARPAAQAADANTGVNLAGLRAVMQADKPQATGAGYTSTNINPGSSYRSYPDR